MSARWWTAIAAFAIGACASTQTSPPPSHEPPPVVPKKTCAFLDRPIACTEEAPRYEDVQAIVANKCLGCHGNGGVAAEDHDFSVEAHVRAEKDSIATRVSHCAMPPRGATPLDEDEADTILRWVACGAK